MTQKNKARIKEWNKNVETCSDCGIQWKKIGKTCPVCFTPAQGSYACCDCHIKVKTNNTKP